MRLRVGLIVGLLASAITLVHAAAAGTLGVSRAQVNGNLQRVTLTWTSTAGGAVSGNPFSVPTGQLVQVKFVPGAGGTQPTDLYDVTLVDGDGVDVLAGLGANLSQSTASIVAPRASTNAAPFLIDATTLDLVVANAGSAKSGTVTLWIGR
jgi:hypothetical protein